MVDCRETLDATRTVGLTPHVVEKDHVPDWSLSGTHWQSDFAGHWIFKGAICLKFRKWVDILHSKSRRAMAA